MRKFLAFGLLFCSGAALAAPCLQYLTPPTALTQICQDTAGNIVFVDASTGPVTLKTLASGSGGGGSGGVTVYPATATASFPFGFSSSSTTAFGNATSTTFGAIPYVVVQASGSSIGTQYYCNGNASGSNSNANGGCVNMEMGTSQSDGWVIDYTNVNDNQLGIRPFHLILGVNVNDPGILVEKLGTASNPGLQVRAAAEPSIEYVDTTQSGPGLNLANGKYKTSVNKGQDSWSIEGRTDDNSQHIDIVEFYREGSTNSWSNSGDANVVLRSTAAFGWTNYAGTHAWMLRPNPTMTTTNVTTLPAGVGTPNQGWVGDGNGNLSYQSVGLLGTAQTWTAPQTYTSSITTTGSGDGQITETVGVSTFTVPYSSAPHTVGYVAVWLSTSGKQGEAPFPTSGGGTPSGPVYGIQYDNSGSFGASSLFQFNGTSVTQPATTFTSTLTVLSGANASGNTQALVDVYLNSFSNGYLANFGSSNQNNQVYITDQGGVTTQRYGILMGYLQNPGSTNASLSTTLYDSAIGTTQGINYGDASGNMNLETATSGNGGKDIDLQPQTVDTLRVSNVTGIRASVAGSRWILAVATNTTAPPSVAVSSANHVTFSNYSSSPVVSSCGTGPTIVGNDHVGTITVGSGVTTACTLTFAQPFKNQPICTESDNSTAITGDISSISATAITFSFSASLGSGKVYYICFGDND